MKVFGWLADSAGCGWYRIMLPLGALRLHGVQTRWSGKITEEDETADVIVCQRVCKSGVSSRLQRLARMGGKRPKIVFELDDDLFSIDQHNRLARRFFDNPEIRQNLIDNIKISDVVTVTTEPLAHVVRQYNTNVVILPNYIPAEMLTWRTGRFTERLTVGWQGSPTHDGDWTKVTGPIGHWFHSARKRGTPAEFHTIGELPRNFPQVYPHRHSAWVRDIDQYYRTSDWHIALAPLAHTPFNLSKSYLRVLEAAMLGYPVVASDVYAYRDFVQHGVTGYLASSPGEWGVWLRALEGEPAMRDEMGDAARRLAADYTIEQHAAKWLEVYSA